MKKLLAVLNVFLLLVGGIALATERVSHREDFEVLIVDQLRSLGYSKAEANEVTREYRALTEKSRAALEEMVRTQSQPTDPW